MTPSATTTPDIRRGYQPGIIGACTSLHAAYYSAHANFGQPFESLVASGLAEFCGRLADDRSEIWSASKNGEIVCTNAIDGGAPQSDIAQLRWFIVGDAARGTGMGRELLTSALAFCDAAGFSEVQLKTFKGLDAARHLYELNGFTLVDEREGGSYGVTVMEQKFVRRCPR